MIKARPSGFTMVELIAYIGLLAIASLALTQFASDALTAAAKTKASKAVQENARFALTRMVQTVRTASSISSGTYGTSPGSVTLATAGGPVTFSVVNDQLLQNGEALTSANVRVTSLQFDPDANDPNVLSISLTVEQGNASAPAKLQVASHRSTRVACHQSFYD